MASILASVAARGASRQLNIAARGPQQPGERLAPGQRLERAADPSADLDVSRRLGVDLRLARQGRRNALEGASYLQVADAALEQVTGLLARAAELSRQATAGASLDRAELDREFQDIIKGIAGIGLGTTFNSQPIFDSSTRLTVALPDGRPVGVVVDSIASSATAALGLTMGATSVSTRADAAAAADLIRTAIASVDALRATLEATRKQLNSVADALGIQVENITGASTRIGDAGLADEVIQLVKLQILNQSGATALVPQDPAPQGLLELLR